MKNANAIMTSMLAALCQVCPLCVCARRWPDSRFAKAARAIEKFCPACSAYAKVNKNER